MAAEARAQYILAFSCFDVIFFHTVKGMNVCMCIHTQKHMHAYT